MGDPNWFGYSTPVRAPQIPVLKEWKGQIGKIYSMYTQPCDPDAWILIQAWVVNIPYLVWAITKPDPIDLTFERFKVGHKKKKRARVNMTDLVLPEQIPSSGLKFVMYKLASAAQRVGFWFIFVDANLDFQVNWVSTAFQWHGCNTPVNWNAAGKLTNQPYTSNGAMGVVSTLWEATSMHNAFCGFEGISSTVATRDCSANVTVQTAPTPGFAYTPPSAIWLNISQTGGEVTRHSGAIGQSDSGGHTYSASGNLGPNPNRRWNIVPMMQRQNGGGFTITSATLVAGATGAPTMASDP